MYPFQFMNLGQSTAYLFPGQGAQSVGMMKEIASEYSTARKVLDEADDILGVSLSRLCFEGPEERLTDTVNAQPAIFAASVAVLHAIDEEVERASVSMSADMRPPNASLVVAGHSLGEYSALVAAGSLTFADGLQLVRERGRLMKEAGEARAGAMAAILALADEKVESICRAVSEETGGVVQVANYNCPGQLVISGDQQSVQKAMTRLEAGGARKVVPLAVTIASHSPLMAPASRYLQEAINETRIADPVLPIIGNTTAKPLATADEIRTELVAQLTGNVRWTETVQQMLANGIQHFVEIGPGQTLAGLVKRIDRKSERRSIEDSAGVQAYAAELIANQP